MTPQVNWTKIMEELNKVTDLDRLKTEVQRISAEIRKFDINAHLSPTAKQRLKQVEEKYHELSKTLNRSQRQMDREFNKLLRNLKTQRARAEKSIEYFKKAAVDQGKKIERASANLKAKVFQGQRKGKKKATKRKTAKAATTSH